MEIEAQTKAPLAKGGCLGTAEAGGFRRQSLRNFLPIPSSLFPKKPSPFHMGLCFQKVPAVNPSVTAAPCQLPLAREPLRVVPADNFARWLSTNRPFPDPPGIVPLCDTGLFPAFNRQRGKEAVPKPTSQNGSKGNRFATRAKAKGQSRMVPPGGFLRGEQFERERVVPPLSRLLCFLSCRSKKGRPRWQAPGVPPVSISLGS